MPATRRSPVTKKAPAARAQKPSAKKAVAKKAAAKLPSAKIAPKKVGVAPKKAGAKKDDGRTVESFIEQRDIDIKTVEEALGIKELDTTKNPPIPGKFDLILPPGTPRKIILEMAKEYNLEVAMRNDYYVPIGVSDIRRELLVFRGDQKTIQKAEKVLLKRLKAWAK